MHKVFYVARSHWFYLVLPFLLAAAMHFRASFDWEVEPRLGEAATIFDWCVFVPLLYAICYRKTARRVLVLRILLMICGGIWIAARIVPDQAEMILNGWSWIRGFGIVILAVLEGMTFIAAMRLVFGNAPDIAILERQGIPPQLIRFMLAEARFWRWVWTRLRGKK